MRILIVEDDAALSRSIQMMLKHSNIGFDITDFGQDAIELAEVYNYDLIVLDLNLPDMDGYEVLSQLRKAGIATPVLVLTGTDDVACKLRSFKAGADDFVTKPFNSKELLARVHAIIRRSNGFSHSLIRFGKVELRLDTKEVSVSERKLELSSKEYQVLELLALRAGETLSKDFFLNNLYGGIDEPDAKIIDVFVCKLRKKLKKATGGDSCIETVWGLGYTINRNLGKSDVYTDELRAA